MREPDGAGTARSRTLRGALAAGLTLGLLTACDPAPPRPHTVTGSAAARLAAPFDLPLERPLRAGFLVLQGVYNTELTAPYDLFHHTSLHTDPMPGIEVFTVSPDGEPVTTFEGLQLAVDYGFEDAPEIDILVVPSAEGNMDVDLEDERLIEWVRRSGQKASFVVSLCDGAFVLAAAGLLDGRAATTFPGDQDRFAEMFPRVELHREPSFVHDGPTLTSQGGAKSFDVALYLIAHIFGDDVARGVGRGLIIDWPPERAEVRGLVIAAAPGSEATDR